MYGTLLAENAAFQVVAWVVEMINQLIANWDRVSLALAAALSLYLVLMIADRFQNDEDPSLRWQSSSGAGSMSVLISGVHVTMLLAGVIAFLLWPIPLEQPFVAAVLLGIIAAHYYLEKQEVSGN